MQSWVGTKNVVFCNSCNAPTPFLKSTKRGLKLSGSDGTLQTCCPLWSTI